MAESAGSDNRAGWSFRNAGCNQIYDDRDILLTPPKYQASHEYLEHFEEKHAVSPRVPLSENTLYFLTIQHMRQVNQC